MNITHQLFDVGVVPNLNGRANFVRRVRWGVTWEDSGFSSSASVESVLPFDEAAAFRPIESVSKDDVVAWAIAAQGGQQFIDNLAQYHTADLAHQIATAGVVSYEGHFELNLQQVASPPADDTAFAPIFPTPASGAIDATVFE